MSICICIVMFGRLTILFTLSSLFVTNALHSADGKFSEWLTQFNIHVNDESHRDHLFLNWLANDKHIETTNDRNMTYTLGHNHFSGLNTEEFSQYLGYSGDHTVGKFNPDKIKSKVHEIKCLNECVHEYDSKHKLDTVDCVSNCLSSKNLRGSSVPDAVNWVELGGVTPVKDQGQCGSCWSFSTTGALEGAYFAKNHDLKSFSEQQLVSCDNRKNTGTDMGCNGGLMDSAFTWIENNKGLCSESDYPYTSGTTKQNGNCESSCGVVTGSDITDFFDVSPSSDAAMMEALSQQPVSIAIEADQKDFQLYKSGVFTGSCGTNLDHGVLAVGYGSENGQDYYLVKNSWNTVWGDAGYIKLGRGDEFNGGDGQCGMLMQASYPVV